VLCCCTELVARLPFDIARVAPRQKIHFRASFAVPTSFATIILYSRFRFSRYILPSVLLPFLSSFHAFLISLKGINGCAKTGRAVSKPQVTEFRKRGPLKPRFCSISRHSLSTQQTMSSLRYVFLSSSRCTASHDAPLTSFLSRLPREFDATARLHLVISCSASTPWVCVAWAHHKPRSALRITSSLVRYHCRVRWFFASRPTTISHATHHSSERG